MFVLYFPQFSSQIYQILLSYAYFSYIEDYMREIIYTFSPHPLLPKKCNTSTQCDIYAQYSWKFMGFFLINNFITFFFIFASYLIGKY